MLSWVNFAELEPELAARGQDLLNQYGVGLAFLATVRRDGGPRVHPVCPLLLDGFLYIFAIGNSPKQRDLARDGRFAMQTFPEDKPDSDEFYITGRAVAVVDPARRTEVVRAATWNVAPSEVLYELMLESVMLTRWLGFGTPEYHSEHTKWRELGNSITR